MRFIKEFSYPDILQRRIVLISTILTVAALAYLYFDLLGALKYSFIYLPIFRMLSLTGLLGLFLGNVAGRQIFSRSADSRRPCIITDLLFILICMGILFLNTPLFRNGMMSDLFLRHPLLILGFFFCLTLVSGIKIHYLLKVACGSFIDDKKGISYFFLMVILGVFLAVILVCGKMVFPFLHYLAGLIPLLMAPVPFLLKLSYNPSPLYAQDTREQKENPAASEEEHRDDLFFTYMNFSYIYIFLFLGAESITKFFGDFLHIRTAFILTSLLFIGAGFLVADLVRKAFWYIYLEMLYPVAFLAFIVLLYAFGGDIPFYAGISFFSIASLLFGFSIHHTVVNALSRFDHDRRFNIINFSLLVIPCPLLAALSAIDFTYLWYFALFYLVSLSCVLFPGLHLMRRKITGYKKAAYFLFSLFFIPLLIFVHLYFGIPLNSRLYVTRSKGFEEISSINNNAEFIRLKAFLSINGVKAFQASDDHLKNLKRCVSSLFLFDRGKDGNSGRVLVIDGNQKFYSNPLFRHFQGSVVLDVVPEEMVDYQKLPLSGKKFYAPEAMDLLFYFFGNRAPLDMIADFPNLYDQSLNRFRYSQEYYGIVKKFLKPSGIFTQTFDLSGGRAAFLSMALHNMKRSFKRHIAFLFSDYLLVLCSDEDKTFQITDRDLGRMGRLFGEQEDFKTLFFSEDQLLSHILCTNLDDLLAHAGPPEVEPFYFLTKPLSWKIPENLLNAYLGQNAKIMDLVPGDPSLAAFRMNLGARLAANRNLSLLKKMEMDGVREEYESETRSLADLRKGAEFTPELRNYLLKIISFKEDYYSLTAQKREKEKNWEEVKRLYQAILVLTPDHFEANYRMGILSITLQNLEDAFRYLQRAMRLKKDDPKVLYQMGVLLFSSGKTKEALEYLTRARDLNENTASLYQYMGLCYEEIGNINEAAAYYEKAIMIDPNDINIISGLERVKGKIENEKNKWKQPEQKNESEAELGEKIPLPITKSAIDVRMTDEEAKKMEEKENKENKEVNKKP